MRTTLMYALIPVLVVLAIAAVAWLRWLVANRTDGDDEDVEVPEHVGADEAWSPQAEFGAVEQIADWDERAQLHARLDALQDQLHEGLTAVEQHALELLAEGCDDVVTHDRVLLAGAAQ